MPTSSQIANALTIENTFDLLNSTAPINFANWTDTTDWASLGVSSGAGDTAELIYQVIDPVGQYPYQNAGYQADDFSSPDADLTSDTVADYTLFNYAGTTYPIQGSYTVQIKVKVVLASSPSTPIYAYKSISVELPVGIVRTLSLEETFNCASPLTYTSTDTSDYGLANYTVSSIVRTHTVYPPAVAGQSNVTANAAIVILGSPSNALWTNATYEARLTSVITYTRSGNTYITRATVAAEKRVDCQNSLCALKCCLDVLETGYNTYKNDNPTLASQYLTKFTLCSDYYSLIQATYLCEASPDVADLTQKFYATAKPFCTDGCNCGCSEDPAPATASNILQGPTGATGPQGPIGETGETGPAGADGQNGGGLIFSGPLVAGKVASVATTTNGSYETLSSFTTDHTDQLKNLVNVGDTIKLYACFEMTDNPMTGPIGAQLLINGTGLSNLGLTGLFAVDNANASQVEFDSEIILKDNASGAMELRINSSIKVWSKGLLADSILYQSKLTAFDLGGATVDFSANDYTISAQAKSVATGDISLQIYQAEKLAITNSAQSPSTSIKYITPFTTTASVLSYANVVGNTASNIVRVYLDGVLLTSADWTYTQATDTLLFNISITGASEVAADYV